MEELEVVSSLFKKSCASEVALLIEYLEAE
jgi:hypothetical protein